MKCLITGASGFIGSHLAEYLLSQEQTVTAVAHRQAGFLSGLKDRLEIVCGDLLDNSFIADALGRYNPDVIFHLAAQSLPQLAWEEPELTFRINLNGSLKLFEAAGQKTKKPLIIAASSSSVYAPDDKPLAEGSRLLPNSIYAASKLAAEQLAEIYREAKGLRIICVRPFFLIGARKQGDVSSDFARQIVRIEEKGNGELPVGNLGTVRDFLDVRDGVAALWQIALNGKESVYNICSGKGRSIRDLLDMFKRLARVSVREIENPEKIRKIDDPVKIGDPARLMALGWKPKIDLNDSVGEILEYWRKIYKQ